MYADMRPRSAGSLLSCRAGVLLVMQIALQEFAPWLALAVSGVLIPVSLRFRAETREDRAALHKALNDIRDKVHEVATDCAVLRERDRIAEMLDNRLPKE